MGEKLFRGLQGRMKRSGFIAGIQNLHYSSLEKPLPESPAEYRAVIEEVRQAFQKWREIIELHYAGDLNARHRRIRTAPSTSAITAP